MSFEDRLRESMESHAERAEASPDAYDRILERAERPHRPWLAPALAIGGVAAVVAVALAFVGGDDDLADEVVAGGPDSGGVPVASMPMWPVADFDALDAMQRRVDAGEERWLVDPEEVASRYLAEHDVDVDTVRTRPDEIDPESSAHADAVVIGYLGGWVELARTDGAGADAVWFVVGAHDSRLPVVDVVRTGAQVEVVFPIVSEDLDVVIKIGGREREWLTEKTVEVRKRDPGRVTVDLDSEAPMPLILHLRTDVGDGFVGLTEMWVDNPG